MAQFKPRTEFAVALGQIAAERGIPAEVIMETLKGAILAAYRRDARERGLEIPEEELFEVEMHPETGEAHVYQAVEGKKTDVTPPGFSRIAAQTAKQVILQKIREAEKGAVIEEYSKRIGNLVTGMILRFDGPVVVVDLGKTEAVMTPAEQVRSENYRLGQRITFYLEEIRDGMRGQQIIVSRSSENLVKELFRREVPEVSNGSVEVRAIAREPGVRTKIAVVSNRTGIDPVGSCVGQKGVRVGEIISELFGEKIDIIQFEEEPTRFIASALAPAEGLKVVVDEKSKTAKVSVPDDQLSLAIGKEGQNVRLATRLTGYRIDIVGQGTKEGKKAEVVKQEDLVSVEPGLTVDKAKKTKEKKTVKKTEEKAKKAKKEKASK
ncbi:MAG: transcription termination factor NusA [bacterium]|nr:transcription termination factor NusA [bacterium]